MLKYIIRICFVFCCFTGFSQSESIDLNPKDTTVHLQPYGLRAGVDLSRVARSFYDKDYSGLEFVGDYRLSQNLYVAAELGNEKNTRYEDLYNYTTSGSYLKLGIDLNVYDNWYGMNNSIYIGGRYAFSTFKHKVNDYQIFDSNRYWAPNDFPLGNTDFGEFSGLNASWLEFVIGTKVELFSNLYLGASLRLSFLVSNKEDEQFANLWIPGFNKTTEGSKFGVGYNYSLSYMIPLYKKKKKEKEEDVETEEEQTDPEN